MQKIPNMSMAYPGKIYLIKEEVYMYCNNCGKEIPDGSEFCNFCGNKTGGKEVSSLEKTGQKISNIGKILTLTVSLPIGIIFIILLIYSCSQ